MSRTVPHPQKWGICAAAIVFLGLWSFGQDIENVGPQKALELAQAPNTYLVDVRTVAEYAFVGHPAKAWNVPLLFWSEADATMVPNPDFISDLKARFKPGDTLVFMCRGGGRSLRAAKAALGAGFKYVINVTDGFEGKKDDQGHFTIGGWKSAGLPYTYDVDPALAYKRAGQDVCVMRTSMGTMIFKLFDADAPRTVGQFKTLVSAGFYDGKDFYRVVKGHVIQAGGGDAPNLPPEFNANPHVFGTLGLGRAGDENSGDSEIYICVAPRPHLDGKYTVFGQLIEGQEVLKRIAEVPVEEIWTGPEKKMAMHKPLKPVVIEKARIERRDFK